MTPTQRSLSKLRAEGWLAVIVERWNPYDRVRQDLFGFADLLAIRAAKTRQRKAKKNGVVAQFENKKLSEASKSPFCFHEVFDLLRD
ncbi:MAG: hypothetical protein HY674_15520 [Chloroflexi bacterium]|nr:hypothetical protein [Chloroflexota bacterium]